MVFAEIRYPQDYREAHSEILAVIRSEFTEVEAGLQGDSWIWIADGDEKVAVDTFSSLKHQIKSRSSGQLVQRVIGALSNRFDVHLIDPTHEE